MTTKRHLHEQCGEEDDSPNAGEGRVVCPRREEERKSIVWAIEEQKDSQPGRSPTEARRGGVNEPFGYRKEKPALHS